MLFISETDLILVKLEQIKHEIRNLKAIVMQNETRKTTDDNYCTAEPTGFLKTYNIKFPLETNDQFNIFNTQLNTDHNLRQSFVSTTNARTYTHIHTNSIYICLMFIL